MSLEFSFGWFIAGLIITIIGAIMLRFYKTVADFFYMRYDVIQLVSVITCVVGLLVMFNLVPLALQILLSPFTNSIGGGGH